MYYLGSKGRRIYKFGQQTTNKVVLQDHCRSVVVLLAEDCCMIPLRVTGFCRTIFGLYTMFDMLTVLHHRSCYSNSLTKLSVLIESSISVNVGHASCLTDIHQFLYENSS